MRMGKGGEVPTLTSALGALLDINLNLDTVGGGDFFHSAVGCVIAIRTASSYASSASRLRVPSSTAPMDEQYRYPEANCRGRQFRGS